MLSYVCWHVCLSLRIYFMVLMYYFRKSNVTWNDCFHFRRFPIRSRTGRITVRVKTQIHVQSNKIMVFCYKDWEPMDFNLAWKLTRNDCGGNGDIHLVWLFTDAATVAGMTSRACSMAIGLTVTLSHLLPVTIPQNFSSSTSFILIPLFRSVSPELDWTLLVLWGLQSWPDSMPISGFVYTFTTLEVYQSAYPWVFVYLDRFYSWGRSWEEPLLGSCTSFVPSQEARCIRRFLIISFQFNQNR